MNKPIIADKKPKLVDLEKGQDYYFCACGRSEDKVFCDGSHSETTISPIPFTAEKDGKAALCTCKQTKNPPYCDGSHKHVNPDHVGKEME